MLLYDPFIHVCTCERIRLCSNGLRASFLCYAIYIYDILLITTLHLQTNNLKSFKQIEVSKLEKSRSLQN